mgnify:CR=1 FL=1
MTDLSTWLDHHKTEAKARRASVALHHRRPHRPRPQRPAPARPGSRPIRSHFAKIRAAGVRLASELGDPPTPTPP